MTLVLAHADGWLFIASNQFSRPDRLTRLAWSSVHSAKTSLSESLTAAIEHALALETNTQQDIFIVFFGIMLLGLYMTEASYELSVEEGA